MLIVHLQLLYIYRNNCRHVNYARIVEFRYVTDKFHVFFVFVISLRFLYILPSINIHDLIMDRCRRKKE